jgi:D-ribulokinase
MTNNQYYLGLDFGTSGVRGIVIDQAEMIIQEVKYAFNNNDNKPQVWREILEQILHDLELEIKFNLGRIAVNGTSATVLLCDDQGEPLNEAILYNDDRGIEILNEVKNILPLVPVVLSATSSLCKLIWYSKQSYFTQAQAFLHQADWLSFLLHGRLGVSDYHNALKLGYDVENLTYPLALQKLPFFQILPQVYPPSMPVNIINKYMAQKFNINPHCVICLGTTDSIAAFVASGARLAGEAVTSLGSTLVLKLLSNIRVDEENSGIYSHRFGNLWLTGGASNTGGNVLKYYFTEAELRVLSQQINPDGESNLAYYPLLKTGDRFPINDPFLAPQITPIPENRVIFLQGILEGIAKIEKLGYEKLQQLGASPLTQVYTAGGGAKNENWRLIRQKYLQIPVKLSEQIEAAYGSALLAKNGQLMIDN